MAAGIFAHRDRVALTALTLSAATEVDQRLADRDFGELATTGTWRFL
jgi:hypothetical protein